MDYKERLQEAFNRIKFHRDQMNEAMSAFTHNLADLLWPCGEYGCLIGSEDYCDDIYYLYAEPKPNEFHRVTAIRNKDGRLQVRLDLLDGGDYSDYKVDENGWMDFSQANVTDLTFLAAEVECNLEYSDGYQPEEEDEFKFLIDEDGSKYNPATSILSGGMDIRCDFNEEALFAYKTKKTIEAITEYLVNKGWVKTPNVSYQEFRKGNTICFFDDWGDETEAYGCFGTEYAECDQKHDEDIKAPAELKAKLEADSPKTKRYTVPFIRTQWADVYVEATSPEEAIEKAEAMFNEDHADRVDWEDMGCPEYDEFRGVEEQ